MIEEIGLWEGVTLRCFPDSRFKQGALSIQFVRPMRRQEASSNALLPAVLLRGTARTPDLRSITLRLDDLYGASVGTLVRRIGDYQTTGIYCTFMEDKYALSGDQILSPVLDFLEEILFCPLLENGVFSQAFVESEKKNLIATLDAEKNDKRIYASARLMRHMCKEDSFGIPRLGDRSLVEQITAQSLYAHYQTLLRESRLELFYVGSRDAREVAELLRLRFARCTHQALPLPPQTAFAGGEKGSVCEQMEVSQGKLAMGYVTPITVRDPRFVAMQMCNTILGGMTGKLFQKIREEMSLCYDISAGYHGSKGILVVSAGIDAPMQQTVEDEVERQIELLRQGNLTRQEIENARQALLTSLESTHDSPGAIESYYATAALSGLGMTPEAYMAALKKVTKKQICQAAETLERHTVFFLKGVGA